jgi:hypothetical protein
VDHAHQPFSVATYSAATPRGGVSAPLVRFGDGVRAGAMAVVPAAAFAGGAALDRLSAAGALGFVTDAPSCRTDDGLEQPGRIELDASTTLVGFSVTSRELALLEWWADRAANADVRVDVERSASMPVVTAVLEGRRSEREVWMTAHLCHPRPSANDNASGVAAVLGVAAAHAASRARDRSWATDRTIRFVWAPEFAGSAAALHARTERADHAAPVVALNLDMVGEDQSACGSPFLVERDAGGRRSLITPVAEHLVEHVFRATATPPDTWRPVPFAGSSDHAVFADPKLDCAAIALCHAPDRFNHSAADSIDKVAPVEMRRAAAAGAAIAFVMAGGSVAAAGLRDAVSGWVENELAATRRVADAHAEVDGGAWSLALTRHAEREAAALLALADGPAVTVPQEPGDQLTDGGGPRVTGCWDGPLNVRALIGDMPPDARSAVGGLIAADVGNRALLTNLAIRADGRRDRAGIVADASYALLRPIDAPVAETLFDAMLESGWVTEVPAEQAAQRGDIAVTAGDAAGR